MSRFEIIEDDEDGNEQVIAVLDARSQPSELCWLPKAPVGVLGLDAGGVSGLAWWHGELKGDMDETLCNGTFGFQQIDCGRGRVDSEREGAEAIAGRYVDCQAEWTMDGVPAINQFLLIEDFALRAKVTTSARVGLSSPRIAALVEGMLVRVVDGRHIARYAPSRSKRFGTSVRLREWGLWARSAPHSRDAARLIAVHVAELLKR